MSYLARKKCSFGGIDYLVGDTIPHDAVMPERVRTLVKSGMIAVVNETEEGKVMVAGTPRVAIVGGGESLTKVLIPIMAKEGTLELELYPEEVTKYFEIAQLNSEEAMDAIKFVESQDLLILIDCVHPLKTAKEAAKKRAKVLIELEVENTTEEIVESDSVEPEQDSEEPQEGGEA